MNKHLAAFVDSVGELSTHDKILAQNDLQIIMNDLDVDIHNEIMNRLHNVEYEMKQSTQNVDIHFLLGTYKKKLEALDRLFIADGLVLSPDVNYPEAYYTVKEHLENEIRKCQAANNTIFNVENTIGKDSFERVFGLKERKEYILPNHVVMKSDARGEIRVFKTIDAYQVSIENINEIISARIPKGKFYAYDQDKDLWIGCDNSSGDAWTEDFDSTEALKLWFEKPESVTEDKDGE